jgi:tetrahydrodipicolinate N-succinyltransferase
LKLLGLLFTANFRICSAAICRNGTYLDAGMQVMEAVQSCTAQTITSISVREQTDLVLLGGVLVLLLVA